jgi:hypothetical protein
MSGQGQRKEEVITFKVDGEFAEALAAIRNRSDFIRHAVLNALGNTCPLCNGIGTLTVSQMRHWRDFENHHHVGLCDECHEAHVICDHEVAAN